MGEHSACRTSFVLIWISLSRRLHSSTRSTHVPLLPLCSLLNFRIVIQEIAKECLLPLPRAFAKSIYGSAKKPNNTPRRAIVLHLIICIILVGALPIQVSYKADMYLLVYPHSLLAGILSYHSKCIKKALC